MTNNNYYEWSERFLNSRASDNIIDDLNIDQSVDIDWDVTQSFGGGIDLKGSSIDLSGGSLTDTGQDYLDLTGDGNDLRLATGQSIEDGSSQARLLIKADRTELRDSSDNLIVYGVDGGSNALFAYNGQGFQLKDQEGGFNAVQYDTDPSAGVLRTPNASARIEADGVPSSGEGMEFRYSAGSPSVARILSFDRSSGHQEFQLEGDPLVLEGHGGLVDMSTQSADLRLATEQAIEDENGAKRFSLGGGRTSIRDETGAAGFFLNNGNGYDLQARSNTPLRIFDQEGFNTAVQYDTDPSAGVLRTPNASVVVEDTGSPSSGSSISLRYDQSNNDGEIISYDWSAGSYTPVNYNASLHDFSFNPADLRLATGQSIEDGSGTHRFEIGSSSTYIRNSSGRDFLRADDDVVHQIHAHSTEPVTIRDNEGNFDAVQYTTDTSTGTLELTNAELSIPNNGASHASFDTGSAGFLQINSPDGNTGGTGATNIDSPFLRFRDDSGAQDALLHSDGGEIIGTDAQGNNTTLT